MRATSKKQQDERAEVAAVRTGEVKDQIDTAIDEALETGSPIDQSKAFPYAPPKVGQTRSHISDPPIDVGSLPEFAVPKTLNKRTQTSGSVLDDQSAGGMGPKERLQHVANVAPGYLEEYKLQLLHRLLMRGLHLDVISGMLGVPVATLYEWRKRLFKRLREEAKRVDIYLLAGKTLTFYSEIQSISLRMASDTAQTSRTRLESLRTAMAAESLKNQFLTNAGFFEHAQFKPADPESVDRTPEQAQRTLGELNAMLGIDDADDVFAEQESDGDDETVLLWQ